MTGIAADAPGHLPGPRAGGDRRAPAAAAPSPALRAQIATLGLFAIAAVAVIGGGRDNPGFIRAPFRGASGPTEVRAAASSVAFGKSGGVKMHVAMPGAALEFPLSVSGDPSVLRYQWLRLDGTPADTLRALPGANLVAPATPGFYRLALHRGDTTEVLPEPTLGVLMPFESKRNGSLNGYRIGTYVSERLGGSSAGRPEGFLEVREREAALRVSEHLTIGDFLTHDDQGDVWPKYVALSPQLLDKIELVIAEVQKWRLEGSGSRVANLSFGVSSGFRAPAHNARVRRAARDSRHQYGDAADVVMDADGDGRITAMDSRLVALAVEMVELRNPEMAGGLGLYTSGRYRTPYVHIDARGVRSRWRG